MNRIKQAMIDFAVDHARIVVAVLIAATLGAAVFLPRVQIDTDPENMLEKTEPVRVFHNLAKKNFDLSDTLVVGVINDTDPDGVFNPKTLGHVYELTQFAKTLWWEDKKNPGHFDGVLKADLIAPSLIDHISQAGPGTIRFQWLMPGPPITREEALAVRERILSNPMLTDMVSSKDGKALCLYLPLTDKLLSYKVFQALNRKIESFHAEETYHITGLPVAEGAVGVEMFTEMKLASPLAMVMVFALLLLFFRKWALVVLPMIIASICIVISMGLMIALGFEVHILSSMLPIFLMSISIVDCIHVLSEFFDVYTSEKGRKASIKEVMSTLFTPMLYTSLTTSVGFLSLTLTSLPPARVFGLFLSFGVMLAWVCTIMLVPACLMFIPERKFKNFGLAAQEKETENWMTRGLKRLGQFTRNRPAWIMAGLGAAVVLAGVGISQTRINDNYSKRFAMSHPIRKADIALNTHLAGTYTAYLVLDGHGNPKRLEPLEVNPFKRPDVLAYMAGLQKYLEGSNLVGKASSVADIVSKMNQELIDGRQQNYKIPDTPQKVAECYMQFQQGHRPHDLWHRVTPDFCEASIMLQIPSGNSMDMEKVVHAVDRYFAENPPPCSLVRNWAGIHYVNLFFQNKMFWEMLWACAQSFFVVLVMMTVLFRSLKWGLLCMVPLTITIGAIYGIVGLVGKDYDMPVAVISVLSIGIAVDFAIHFLERARNLYKTQGSWEKVSHLMFGEPARAISRNVMVIALGFLPLMLAALVPYKITGLMLFGILLISGVVTLLALPVALGRWETAFFKTRQPKAARPIPQIKTEGEIK